jgi:DNA primase
LTTLDMLAARYHAALVPGSPAHDYLSGRGISQKSIDWFRLGVVDGSYPEHVEWEGRISVPYITKLGGVKGFKFRRVGDDESEAKFKSSHMPVRLYNPLAFEEAERLGYIGLTEGEPDTWAAYECGIPAVGIPGVDTWAPHKEWRYLFDGVDRVLWLGDNDDAGKKLERKVMDDLRNIVTVVKVTLPLKDLNKTYQEHGREFVRNAAGLD